MSDNKNTSLRDNKNLRFAVIAGIISLVLAPILAAGVFNLEWSVVVMVVISVVAFFAVVFIMIIGSMEDHYPSAASDSASVLAWSERLGAAEQAQVEETIEDIEDASGAGEA